MRYPNPRNRWQKIVNQYPDEQELINLLQTVEYRKLREMWNCTDDLICLLRKKLGLQPKVFMKHTSETIARLKTVKRKPISQETIAKILNSSGYQENLQKHKWKQIVNQYSNQNELINLLQTVEFAQLAKQWNCSEDVIYTLREKLGLKHKRVWKRDLLANHTKEQLEDLYLNKFDRHIEQMSNSLGCYIMTLSDLFKDLGIQQKPHKPGEYESARKKMSEKAKANAAIKNPIVNIWGGPSNPAFSENLRKKRMGEQHPKKNTECERLLWAELEKRKIVFTKHKSTLGITQPDAFIESNICIFVDGCYYHCCQECFDWSKKNTDLDIYIKWAPMKDKRITSELIKYGYKVFRFWEHDINKDVSKCIDQVSDYISSRQETK